MYQIPICNEELIIYGDCPCSDPPEITGVTPLTVAVGEEFDPLQGVTAEDCEGNPVIVTVEE